MSERTLLNKVKKLKELEAQQKELEKQISAVQAEIKAEMTRQDKEELAAGEHIIRWTTILSNRFDSKAFRQEHSRLYKRYCKEMETRRFTVA